MLFSRRPNSFENALATCLDDLDAGAPLEEVLAKYPQHAADLAPLLAVAAQMRTTSWPALSMHGRVQGRERMHAALAQHHSGFALLRPSWAQAAMALVIVGIIGAASVITPWKDLPSRFATPAPAAGPTTTSQQTVVVPDDTATATATTEPSATPTLQISDEHRNGDGQRRQQDCDGGAFAEPATIGDRFASCDGDVTADAIADGNASHESQRCVPNTAPDRYRGWPATAAAADAAACHHPAADALTAYAAAIRGRVGVSIYEPAAAPLTAEVVRSP